MLTAPHLQGYTSVSDLALFTALLPVVRREVRMRAHMAALLLTSRTQQLSRVRGAFVVITGAWWPLGLKPADL